jgi:iron complex outermembrane receptor protein
METTFGAFMIRNTARKPFFFQNGIAPPYRNSRPVRTRALALTVSALCAGPCLVLSPLAAAETTVNSSGRPALDFSIPSGSLSGVLLEFSEISGKKVLFPADLVRGLNSPGLQGRYTAWQALHKLLAGSGLSPKETGSGSITLERAPKAQPSSSPGTSTLPPVTVAGNPDYDPTDPYNPDYTVPNATTATKTDTPIFDTPLSIQVVPRQLMQDRQTYQLKQTIETVSGVRTNQLSGYADHFIIRGIFQGDIYRNGLNLDFTTLDPANIQSIEVLKGPAAVLYGRLEPGGIVNVVTKKPLATPYYDFEQQFGSYDLYRTRWDATGPVNEDGSLLYRFSGVYQNSASFRDFSDLERVLIDPSLTWRLSDKTEITLDLEALLDNTHADYFGIPAIGDRPAPVPIGRSFQDPNDPDENFDRVRLGFNLIHHFNDDWTLNNRFLAAYHDHREVDLNPAILRDDNRTLDRVVSDYGLSDESYQFNLDLTGKFKLWETQHQTLVGFDYRNFDRQSHFFYQDYENPDPALAIDLFNPHYGLPLSVFDTSRSNLPFGGYGRGTQEWYGVYFQDHISLWERLHILAGGRQDWADLAGGFSEVSPDAVRLGNERHDQKFSPRVGILYQPWTWLGIYGNWVQSLGQNNGRTANGQLQPPQTGEQYEAGLKAEWFDKSLTATFAYFHITKENLLTSDLSTSDPSDSKPIGEALSEGVELDIAGRITDNFSLTGSYAYTDARITKDNSGLQGNRLFNVPRNSGSFWLKYDVNGYASDEGLSFGVGAFAARQREGDSENSFQLPGYVRMDAMAAYRFKAGRSRITTQLNIRNMLDKTYYEDADIYSNNYPRFAIWPGQPLTVLGSVRIEY